MLAAIRERVTGILAAIIVGMLIVPFALWGINSYFEGGSSMVVAEGAGIKVTQIEYRNTLDRYRASVKPEMFESIFFKQQVVESLISDSLLERDMQSYGYRVSDQVLSQYIQGLSYFQRDNKFDSELYKTSLAARRMNIADFEQRTRNDLAKRQIIDQYRKGALITKSDTESILKLMLQQRQVAYVVIKPDSFLGDVKATKEEVEQYYNSNSHRFQTAEQVQVEYLTLSAQELVKDFQPSEQELRDVYEADENNRFTTPEKRRVSHILIEAGEDASDEAVQKTLAKASDIVKQLRQGKSFSRLAKKHSQDPGSAAKGGDLGFLSPGLMAKEFEAAARKLKKGEISDPVRTKYGYHVIKLTDYKPEKRTPFAKVKDKIAEQLRRQQGEERFFNLSERFYNLTYENPDSLKIAADELGLKVRKSSWFGRGGGPGIAAKPQVAAAAFLPEVLEQGRNSEPVEVDDTTLVAVRVVGHRTARTRPLVEVKKQIESIVKGQHASKRAAEKRDQLLKELQGDVDLNVLAKKHKLTYHPTEVLVRGQAKDVDKQIVDAVFEAKRPVDKPVYGSVDLGGKGFAVFALNKVVEGDPAKADEAMKNKVKNLLDARRGSDYYHYYTTGLRQEADIKVYSDNL